MNRLPLRALALALAISLPVAPLVVPHEAGAGRMSGVEMADSVRAEGRLLRLNGMANYRKFGFQVLVAGLYLSERSSDPAKILAADSPRRYVTHFKRSVGAERICEAWRDGLKANTPHATAEVREQFRTLCRWMRDFRKGDEITVTYLPGRGSEVEINGIPIGIMRGKGFADAYFGLALGPKPSLGKKFKQRLLGG